MPEVNEMATHAARNRRFFLVILLTAAAFIAACCPGAGSAATDAGREGWHLVETRYFQSESDTDILGGPVKNAMTGTGALLLTYYRDEGETGNRLFSTTRTNEEGKTLAKAEWRVTWKAPAAFLPGGESARVYVEHELIADWGTPPVTAIFDMPDMIPGKRGASPILFVHEHGTKGPYRDTREEVFNARETMTTRNPLPEGKPGDRRAVYLHFGVGYGMRYTYEWKTASVPETEESTGTGTDGASADIPPAGPSSEGISSEDRTASGKNGWHLVESRYFQSESDVDILGGPVKNTMPGTSGVLLTYYRDAGETGNRHFSTTRTNEAGKTLAKAEWRVAWKPPADFLPAEETASVFLEHELISDWGTPAAAAYFDAPDMVPGKTGSSPIVFMHIHGAKGPYRDTREEVFNARETLTTKTPLPLGKPGDRRAVYLHFGVGYGMRYTYEWR